jgi:hypothetical protein
MRSQLDADGDGHVSTTEVLGAVKQTLDADVHVVVEDASEILAASAGALERSIGATQKDVADVMVYLKAVTALYGSIVFWYGAWTQFDVGFSQLGFRWATGAADGSPAPVLGRGTALCAPPTACQTQHPATWATFWLARRCSS